MQAGLFGTMPTTARVTYDEPPERPTKAVSGQQSGLVRCCDCKRFQRDTEGISFSVQTGEYFMGICPKGHTDGARKVFADKARECNDYL